MIWIEANHIKKIIGERLLFSVDQLRVKKGDRIGLIGQNREDHFAKFIDGNGDTG
jgi:ATPase subunit of ABC transporter with duplicated ATPase domains